MIVDSQQSSDSVDNTFSASRLKQYSKNDKKEHQPNRYTFMPVIP